MALNVLDLATTMHILLANGIEANPIPRYVLGEHGYVGFVSFKYYLTVGLTTVLGLTYVFSDNKELMVRLGVAANSLFAFPVANNAAIIFLRWLYG